MDVITIVVLLLIITGISLLIYKKQRQRQIGNDTSNSIIQEGDGRYPNKEESEFIESALEEYTYNIIFALTNTDISFGKYRQQALLSENDEVLVQIEILNDDDKLILANCYFSGKCDIFFEDKKTSFNGFDLENISKALKELGVKG